MRKDIALLTIVATLVFLRPASTARADELSELKQQVETQNRTLSQLQQRIAGLEAAKKEGIVLPGSIKWTENIKMSGDFRYRHDHTDKEDMSGGWENGVDRHRVRARLMIEAIVNGDWDVAVRIASGSGSSGDSDTASPISTNQDLEDAFSSKHLWLDLAFFKWHPAAQEGLNVFGGKMKNPFYRVGKSQLIWDGDLNPEGIAAQYARALSDVDKISLRAGGFWVDESGGGADTSLWGAQAHLKHTIGKPDYVIAGVGYYDYGNLEGRGALSRTYSATENFYGNTNTGAGGVYSRDYDILEVFGEYGFEYAGRPLAVFANLVQNTAVGTKDTGWLIGGKLNKAKAPGSWQLSYDYRDLEADAVVGGFTESDFLSSRTESRGHKFAFQYQLAKNLRAGLVYYHLQDISGTRDLDYRRLQTSLIFKF
ncbi:MAG: putative porin [Planctomycetota bacterium]|jgi:hypothetical protein